MPASDSPMAQPFPTRRSLRQQNVLSEASAPPLLTSTETPTLVDGLKPSDPAETSLHPETDHRTLGGMPPEPAVQPVEPADAGLSGIEPTSIHTELPPLLGLGGDPEPVLPARVRSFAGAARLIATAGAAALILTAALPGVTVVPDDQASAASRQQHLLLGALNETDLDSLALVEAEEIGSPSSLLNSAGAEVQFPVSSNVQLTDGYGYRSAPIAQFHNAQDFAAPEGTPVGAMAAGKVLAVGFTDDGLGYNVTLEHTIDGESVTSRYGHMQMGSSTLQVGDTVAVGERIGNVGNTGFSFGAHLHLVIKVEDEDVDPMVYIPAHNKPASTPQASPKS